MLFLDLLWCVNIAMLKPFDIKFKFMRGYEALFNLRFEITELNMFKYFFFHAFLCLCPSLSLSSM